MMRIINLSNITDGNAIEKFLKVAKVFRYKDDYHKYIYLLFIK